MSTYMKSIDVMSFLKTKHYELQVLVPFVGVWKPCAMPLPYHIQIHNPAATHTANAEQKGSRLL